MYLKKHQPDSENLALTLTMDIIQCSIKYDILLQSCALFSDGSPDKPKLSCLFLYVLSKIELFRKLGSLYWIAQFLLLDRFLIKPAMELFYIIIKINLGGWGVSWNTSLENDTASLHLIQKKCSKRRRTNWLKPYIHSKVKCTMGKRWF